jgi:hypothetical protein
MRGYNYEGQQVNFEHDFEKTSFKSKIKTRLTWTCRLAFAGHVGFVERIKGGLDEESRISWQEEKRTID